MDSTRFSKQCKVLSELYDNFSDDEEWEIFFLEQDMGVPLALLFMRDACQPTEIGKAFVEESWNALCEVLDIDFFSDYDSLEAMLEFSDNWTWAKDE